MTADPASPGPFAPEDGGRQGRCGLSDDDDMRIRPGRGGGEAPRGARAGLRGRDGGASRAGAFFIFYFINTCGCWETASVNALFTEMIA